MNPFIRGNNFLQNRKQFFRLIKKISIFTITLRKNTPHVYTILVNGYLKVLFFNFTVFPVSVLWSVSKVFDAPFHIKFLCNDYERISNENVYVSHWQKTKTFSLETHISVTVVRSSLFKDGPSFRTSTHRSL